MLSSQIWRCPLPQFGVSTTFVDAHDLDAVTAAIRPNTKAIYLETLGNPNSDITPPSRAARRFSSTSWVELVSRP